MPAADASSPPPRGLVVRPFRGLRYRPDKVSDLAAVTSPPYDVIDPDSVAHLEELDPHNVVRLILPRPGAGSDRYAHAGDLLAEWMADGVLERDEKPALYVYEQAFDPGATSSAGATPMAGRATAVRQRGLIAAVGLSDPAERVILPHEDVMPGPVADRLELMRATSANLEPILLVYDGAAATAQFIDEACSGEPLISTCTEDGWLQRLWAVTDPAVQRRVAADLQPRQVLIADGHHRYETYRRLQAEHRRAGHGAGDWDLGLALLVDAHRHPLGVQAIHRVVAGLSMDEAVDGARPVFSVTEVAEAANALSGGELQLATTPLPQPFLLTDGTRWVLLGDPDPAAVDRALPPDLHSPGWRSLDASVLHALLLEACWGVRDDSGRIGYLHDAAAAVRTAHRDGGVAILLRPVDVGTVRALAARGERMPRKSTSFGPKPRSGLVLRLLER